MKYHLLQLSARIRAICILLALFLVPGMVHAYDVYLLTKQTINGTAGNYDVPSKHKFTQSSGSVYTYTITSMPATGFWFRIGVNGWENKMQPYNNGDTLTINGDSYTITKDCYGKDKAWKVSYTENEYESLTITVDLTDNNRYVKITGVKSSTGGGGSSTSGDESADNSDTESTTAGYGVPDKFGGVILRYNSKTAPTAGNLFDWKDYFSVAYLTPDSKSYKSNFAPYFNYLIKDVASHAEVENGWDGYVVSMSQSTHPLSISAYGNPDFLIGNWSNSTSWTVSNELNYTKPYLDKINSSHAGMLDFPLRTFIYNIEQGKYSDASVKGWQALAYLSQIAPTNNNRSSVVGSGRSNDAIYNRLGVTFVNNDKINDITGDENIKKAYAVILTAPGTPVVNYSDLTKSNLNDDILRLIKIRQWAGVKNTSAFMTSEDKNYNNAYDYHIQGDFAELKVVVGDEAYVANYEKNGNNGETTGGTDDRNNAKFGGDGYNYTLLDEGTGWRVWYKNNNNTDAIHVAISPEGGLKTGTVNCTGQVIGIAGSGERKFAYTTDGTAPVLRASNTKEVTYTWNSTTQSGKIDDFSSTHPTVSANGGYVTVIAQAIKDGALTGAIDTVTYRFNDYVPLAVKLTPPTATVPYGTSLTPKAEVINTTDATRSFAFTIDGTNPVINTKDASAGNESTWVVTYTYDPVIPTSDLGTFYMAPGNVLTFIDHEGKTTTLTGTSVTVKAQAVQTVTSDGTTTYRLEGDIATGTYVFKTAGIKPAGNYTISVTNDNHTDKPSINKVTATVTVKNENGEEDKDVDVYYTIDGSDPAAVGNAGARLVKGRKIEVYGIANLEHGAENYIRVAIAGSEPLGDDVNYDDEKTHAHCKFDLTCSTSEGGYINYRDGYTDQNLKTYGGDGHIVVYILPWSSKYASQPESSNDIWVQNALQGYQSKEDLENYDYGHNIDHVAGLRVPFIYAYENIVKDGVVKSKALTHSTHTIDVFTDVAVGLPPIPNLENQENQENQEEQETYPPYCWYYVDLVPDDNYKEVNVEVGYYDLITDTCVFTPATIANVHNDMFLKFDVATGQIKDVTYEYTGEHFYTTGVGGTKSEATNPKAGERFFYVKVPEAWTINGNSVKVLKDDKVYTDAKVEVQPSAETSCLSKVCKITLSEPLTEGTQLTIQPYKDSTPSSQELTVNYVNGGYYFYESATHNTPNAPLVFGADADGDVQDQRPYGHRDVNHTLETQPAKRVAGTGYMGYGDYTYYLTPNWTYSSTTEKPTTDVDDNWNGKSATVNTIAKGTTISQTVEGLPTDGNQFTVQMIVRGTEGAEATLKLVGSEYTHTIYTDDESSQEIQVPYKNASASVSKTFAGYDAQGTVTTDGRVEYLLKTDKKNGWQKLETKAAVGKEGKLTISLTAEGGELQLSDVTLLCNANTPPVVYKDKYGNIISTNYYPTIWTSAPTNSDTTEYDLTDRQGANEFSFFDRGDNRNAVIYADKNTVLGMSANTYNVAVPTEYKSESYAKHRPVFRAENHGVKTGLPFENATGHTLVFYDKPEARDNEHTWGTSALKITWDRFSWNRKFLGMSANSGKRNTIFLPFAMSNDQITAIFGTDAMIYKISSVNTEKLEVTGEQAKQKNPNTGEEVKGTKPNEPYILELPETWEKDGVSYDDKLVTYNSKYVDYSNATTIGDEDNPQGQFVGVYKYTNITPEKYEKGYDYYGYDANRGGKFNFFSKNGARFKPFRAYLKIKTSVSKSKPFYYFVVDEGGTTGIDGVSATTLTYDAPVYNLQGQLVRQAGQHTQLPKGLYIQKGRKFVQQ